MMSNRSFQVVFLLITFLMLTPQEMRADTSQDVASDSKDRKQKNVILIAIDDLNDWVGCLDGHPQAHSPNIDRLAERGTLFTNAHCQAPICNPSRASIMYGIRPSTSGVYMNSPKPWTVPALKNRVTLPRHFAANGYKTYTTGKIYHASGLPENDFEVVGPRPGQKNKLDKRLVPPTPDGAKGLWDFGGQTYDEKLFNDYVTASWAIEQLESHASADEDRPFFMAIGFYRPHVPFYAPSRVMKELPIDQVELPKVIEGDRDDIPAIAGKLMVAPVAPDHAWFVESGRWKEAVQSYLACIRYTDEQVGRLLDTIDQGELGDNTIVILYSDHGFFLGEKDRWAKQALWENATRVPFIVVNPGGKKRAICNQPAELISIYPTLIELCGLAAQPGLEGSSLVPLLNNADAAWPHVALTTHGKDNHSVRTETHRYIRYRDGSEELYDLRSDPHEWQNLATEPRFQAMKDYMAKSFPKINVDLETAKSKKPNKQQK
jgi:choline-sulfatase